MSIWDVVEVLDTLISPTVYELISSIYFVVLPSVQHGGVSAFCFASMAF